jgi:hypothetical protein
MGFLSYGYLFFYKLYIERSLSMNIDTLTIGELKELTSLLKTDTKQELPFVVGGKYFIRTVTYFATGKVKRIVGKFLVLEDAAWIADTGRFSDAMSKGIMDEVEPVECEMFLNTDSITDAFVWDKKLPKEQK